MAFFDRLVPGDRREKRVILCAFIVGAAALFFDAATKIFFIRNLTPGKPVTVIPGWFDLTLVHNTGAAWSLFAGHGYGLLAFGAVVGAGIVFFFRALAENCPERYYALTLILSGIAGNSFDRLWRGAVVDFLSFHYFDVYYYPVFNVADVALCTGVGIYLLSGFLRKTKPKENI